MLLSFTDEELHTFVKYNNRTCINYSHGNACVPHNLYQSAQRALLSSEANLFPHLDSYRKSVILNHNQKNYAHCFYTAK